MDEQWSGPAYERRKNGTWAWWKEIAGTAIAVIGVMAVPAGWALNWTRDADKALAIHTIQIAANADAQQQLREQALMQRVELLGQVKDLNEKMDRLLREMMRDQRETVRRSELVAPGIRR